MDARGKIKKIFSDGEVMFENGTLEEFLIDHEGIYCWVKHYISIGEELPKEYITKPSK